MNKIIKCCRFGQCINYSLNFPSHCRCHCKPISCFYDEDYQEMSYTYFSITNKSTRNIKECCLYKQYTKQLKLEEILK